MKSLCQHHKKRLLIIQETISHYNTPLFELLNKDYDLTVLHSDSKCKDTQYDFSVIYIPTFNVHYKIHKQSLIRIAKKFDVVICMFNFAYLSFRLLGVLPRRFKLIYWGIGVSASSSIRYDSTDKYLSSFIKGIKRADAVVFYCDYPKKKYSNLGMNPEKMFVANNTVAVNRINYSPFRNIILFVGSLNANKKVDELINQYYAAFKEESSVPDLYIIGDGPEKESVISMVDKLELKKKVILCGEITDENILEEYYSRAFLCISPDQAGLSVLKAMGYGVPFLTHINAITGGELFNIHNGIDGVLIHDFNEIKRYILDVVNNPDFYRELGENAYNYYWNNCKITDMEKSFCNAIEYAISRK